MTFVSHTNRPGGGELALRRYLAATRLRTRLITMQVGGVWEGLETEVIHAPGVLQLRDALKSQDFVIANSMRAAFLTALSKPSPARLVYWVRDGLTDSAMSPLAITLTKQLTARRTHHYLANSEWTAESIRTALGVEHHATTVTYSLSGVDDLNLDQLPRQTPPANANLRLLYLGRITPWKAPDVAVRALGHLQRSGLKATLTIAGAPHFGERKYAASLNSLIASQPGVSLVGHVSDVKSLLESHDVLLHCSIIPEPFGQVVVQGLAAGIPVVATPLGGPTEILRNAPVDLGYSPSDPHALADAVERSLGAYTELSKWGLSQARNYSDQKLTAATDQILLNTEFKTRIP